MAENIKVEICFNKASNELIDVKKLIIDTYLKKYHEIFFSLHFIKYKNLSDIIPLLFYEIMFN